MGVPKRKGKNSKLGGIHTGLTRIRFGSTIVRRLLENWTFSYWCVCFCFIVFCCWIVILGKITCTINLVQLCFYFSSSPPLEEQCKESIFALMQQNCVWKKRRPRRNFCLPGAKVLWLVGGRGREKKRILPLSERCEVDYNNLCFVYWRNLFDHADWQRKEEDCKKRDREREWEQLLHDTRPFWSKRKKEFQQ